jgi:hypothetical protein
MGVAAPIIEQEMEAWVSLGGGNSGIVGDANHSYGFHLAAEEVGPDDYSRWRDPNGSDGPYVDWSFACAGDFDHKRDAALRAMHADVLAGLMNGLYPMICEFIGQPYADKPVLYWARWNGIDNLQKYTGQGHDHWSHISWYRSRVDEPANLWVPGNYAPIPQPSRPWPSYMGPNDYFGHYKGPNESHGGYYAEERPDVAAIQEALITLGFDPGPVDGWFGDNTKSAVSDWQATYYSDVTTLWGQVWSDDWGRLFP